MGLLDLLRRLRRFGTLKPARVYCQNCGVDLIFSGGDVSKNGDIYCKGYCLDKELRVPMIGGRELDVVYCSAKQVQKAIRKKLLSGYGRPLQQTT